MQRKITKRRQVAYSVVEYISDYDKGELLDTKVIINDQFLCCIAGCTIEKFHARLLALINKYEI